MSEVIREQRLRRVAQRQGYALKKSRRARDSGTFAIIDPFTNTLVAYAYNDGYGLTLDEVEEWLRS